MGDTGDIGSRRFVFMIALAVVFLAFFIRLVQLQILYSEQYGKQSKENSLRTIPRDPIRGLIFDRNGALLVDNRPSYTVTLMPAAFDTSLTGTLAAIVGLDSASLRSRIQKGWSENRFAPIKIKRDINFATLSLIEERREQFPGLDYQIEAKRFYPTRAKASHLYGYIKEISDQQLMEMSLEYKSGDNIGASGLEAAYERDLRGMKGYEFILVNARGQMLGSYNDGRADIPVREGNNLYLAIDGKLQTLAESLLAGRRGAIVAVDPADGGVLALASKPDYDLTYFGAVTPPEVWNSLNTDSAKPLFNRATLTRYPPGSTFKMVLAAAALQEGVITNQWRVQCNGLFHYGNKLFKDHIPHGSTNVVEAIQRSCNVFFYQLMLKTGLPRWTAYGREFGFGAPTNIDILEETAGLLPSEEYFDRVYGKGRWTQGYLISLAIGQGEVGVSPIQMACYAAALGNKGYYHQPHVVLRVQDKTTGQIRPAPYETRRIELSEQVWGMIRDGMARCVNDEGGTGGAARVKGITVAGKTGTAQNPPHKDHAWFVGFAPFEHPRIAICVLIENAGFGGAIAAPIAGLCIEQYLSGSLSRPASPQIMADLGREETARGGQ